MDGKEARIIPQLEKSFSTLLALSCLSAPGVQAAAPNPAQTAQQLMPDGLIDAFLAASAQHFQAGTDGYRYAEQKVTALDGAAGDEFGYSVAIDGDIAPVGAPGHQVGANGYQCSVYVFTRSGTTWSLEQELTASDGALSDEFDWSVALSGTIAVVGAHYHDVGANADQGSAYVFTRIGTTWTQQGKPTASDGAADDLFGHSVTLSGDTALVGAHGDDVGANSDQGSAYVFTGSGATWTQQGKLTSSDGAEMTCLAIRWRSRAIRPWWGRSTTMSAQIPTRARPISSSQRSRSACRWC